MSKDVVLEVAIKRLDDTLLQLGYRVVNRSSQTIYLTTPLTEVTSEGVVARPAKVYAFLDMEGILHITKRLWLMPEEVDVYLPEVPRLTQVLPGGHFEEMLSLKVPVTIDYPYRFLGDPEPEEPPEMIVAEANGIAVSVGYVMQAMETVEYGGAVDEQTMLQATAISSPVLIQDYDQ